MSGLRSGALVAALAALALAACGSSGGGASGGAGHDGAVAGTSGGEGGASGADAAPSTDVASGETSDAAPVSDATSSDGDGPSDAKAERCFPLGCQQPGGQYCGSFPDGCGGITTCGNDCPTGQTCGGGGTAHVCGGDPSCKPIACKGPGYQFCGIIGDGCNKALDCGACTLPQTCGGGGTKNVCQ